MYDAFYPGKIWLDRPHIIYNETSGKYVCWMKIMQKDGTQTETVMTAATAHFYRNGKHYLLTSGTTGYMPNPSEIAVADRWLPELMDMGPMKDTNRNTSIADYVWLPLRFEEDMVYIDWHDEWRIEDYE